MQIRTIDGSSINSRTMNDRAIAIHGLGMGGKYVLSG